MRLLIIANGRLAANGSAAIAVMCGLTDAALKKGWNVTHLALVHSAAPADWEIPYDFEAREHNLRQISAVQVAKETNRFARFIGGFWHPATLQIIISTEVKDALSESYDLAIAFDSLAIPIVAHLKIQKKICIIGDPAGRRLWHSTPWSSPITKLKALALDIAEYAVYRTIPKEAILAMFGSGHALHWSRLLARPVIDLRPFLTMSSITLPICEPDKPIISFGGTLANTASRQSIHLIVHGLLPALRARFGKSGFTMRLIGEAPPLFTQLANQFEEIELTGRVLSFEQELARGEIFILPMNYPVGVRTRLCAALSAGNICLVHPSVLFNMPELAHCAAVKPVRNPQDYINAIASLPSGEARLQLRRDAIAFFNHHYAASMAAETLFKQAT